MDGIRFEEEALTFNTDSETACAVIMSLGVLYDSLDWNDDSKTIEATVPEIETTDDLLREDLEKLRAAGVRGYVITSYPGYHEYTKWILGNAGLHECPGELQFKEPQTPQKTRTWICPACDTDGLQPCDVMCQVCSRMETEDTPKKAVALTETPNQEYFIPLCQEHLDQYASEDDGSTQYRTVRIDQEVPPTKDERIKWLRSQLAEAMGKTERDIDYGLIALNEADIRSVARILNLDERQIQELLPKRGELSHYIADRTMREIFMPTVTAVIREYLAGKGPLAGEERDEEGGI